MKRIESYTSRTYYKESTWSFLFSENSLQILLIGKYFKKDPNSLSNEEMLVWIDRYAKQFREIIENIQKNYVSSNIETIEKQLYENYNMPSYH